jgi:hypothetical protein
MHDVVNASSKAIARQSVPCSLLWSTASTVCRVPLLAPQADTTLVLGANALHTLAD